MNKWGAKALSYAQDDINPHLLRMLEGTILFGTVLIFPT